MSFMAVVGLGGGGGILTPQIEIFSHIHKSNRHQREFQPEKEAGLLKQSDYIKETWVKKVDLFNLNLDSRNWIKKMNNRESERIQKF